MALLSASTNDVTRPGAIGSSEDARSIPINRISWGAVLAGVATSLITQLILNMIGIGIGASTLSPASGDNPTASAFSAGAGIWWALSGIVAAFTGGYAASRLSGRPTETIGSWHGLTTWAVTNLVIFYLLSTAVSGLIGGAFSTVSGALGGLGHTVIAAAQTAAPTVANVSDPFASIDQSVRASTGSDPATLRDAASTAMRAVVTGDEIKAADAREKAAQALSKSQNISVEDARARVADYEKQYRDGAAQAKQKAAEAAEVAARAVSHGALLASLALLLGGLAAWFGGRFGSVDRIALSSSNSR